MPDFIISARKVVRGAFISEPGSSRFLQTPGNRTPSPEHVVKRSTWLKAVMAAGHTHQDPHTGADCGDICVFVHGYNTSPTAVARRHRQLQKSLRTNGFDGALVSFDWPSDDRAINYLEDRVDAKLTALQLVRDGIAMLAAAQVGGCQLNLHVVAHSMGGYVVREAFDDADDRPAIAQQNWNVSQMCLIGADVSSRSMSTKDSRSRSLYRHCTRLSNFYNPYDSVLKLSNVKRAGVAPRAGRKGLPGSRPEKAFDINCGGRYKAQKTSDDGHSWYFGDPVFMRDLAATLRGDEAGSVVAARRKDADGTLHLK